eukprot:CAMPEP_0197445744 /NCGR_PEP_ID=MMETSP1175-20131217/10892_1 /TAXON_ID=1003142 /ORGANISM="Triceratium dubium, Strain CCMP147" /LENGTH=258 /DNA_ID=CAMNT_0042976755 /DNA_START=59 /DNA_END=835 /DNA_ORIENTATION=-
MKLSSAVLLATVASASAFAPQPAFKVSSTALNMEKGAGGMFDTRNPDALEHEDPRKSISAAPSFEEYMKMRDGGGAAAAPAPAAAAPVAAAPAAPAATGAAGGAIDVLSSLQGPGVVWGAEGVMSGHEESELKEYDNFDKFVAALQSTGVASELAGAGPFTVFALTNSAMGVWEQLRGEPTAEMMKMQIVPGNIASGDIRGDLESLGGTLNYRYAVRKHFINDGIIGEKSFGPYPDFPIDVPCSNGVIHAVGTVFAMY